MVASVAGPHVAQSSGPYAVAVVAESVAVASVAESVAVASVAGPHVAQSSGPYAVAAVAESVAVASVAESVAVASVAVAVAVAGVYLSLIAFTPSKALKTIRETLIFVCVCVIVFVY